MHAQTQKITTHLSVHLLHEAPAATGKGITETLKTSLEQLTRISAYENLRKLRGKTKLSIDLSELRKDKNVSHRHSCFDINHSKD